MCFFEVMGGTVTVFVFCHGNGLHGNYRSFTAVKKTRGNPQGKPWIFLSGNRENVEKSAYEIQLKSGSTHKNLLQRTRSSYVGSPMCRKSFRSLIFQPFSELVCKFYIDFCMKKADRVPRGLVYICSAAVQEELRGMREQMDQN